MHNKCTDAFTWQQSKINLTTNIRRDINTSNKPAAFSILGSCYINYNMELLVSSTPHFFLNLYYIRYRTRLVEEQPFFFKYYLNIGKRDLCGARKFWLYVQTVNSCDNVIALSIDNNVTKTYRRYLQVSLQS